MRSFRALVLVLIAALTFGGALSMAAPAFAVPAACHEHGPEKQKPAQVAVNCCAGCLPAPSQLAAAVVILAQPPQAHAPAPADHLESLARAPEPHPPRLV